MVGRCHNPNWNNYFTKTYYKDKGISVCDEWRYNFEAFKKWALNNGYSNVLSIDRINPDGNYEPSNCRWITLEENRNRARRGKKKRRISKEPKQKAGKYEVRYASVYGSYRIIKAGLMYSEAKSLLNDLMLKHKCDTPRGCYYYVTKTNL